MSATDGVEDLEDLIDRWESAFRDGSADDLNAFLVQESGAFDSPVAVEARRRIEALSAMDCLLYGHPASASHSEVDIRPGAELGTGHVLERRIGVGGFGEVWQATGPGGFRLALKIVRLGAKAYVERAALKVVREARHPNLIATFGAWELPGLLVIAMELAERSLSDRMQTAIADELRGIPADELIGYMRDAAGGLDYLNRSRGVQHRDVKPQNLLIVGERVKVADFGNAKAFAGEATGHTGRLSACYAAPEFFFGKTSRHSDQYSLAAAYVHLRTGRPVFPGDGAQVMRGHLHAQPDLRLLPVAERPVVARALNKRPEDRWPNCGAFVEALADRSSGSYRPAIVATRQPRSAIIVNRRSCAANVAKRISCVAIAVGFGLLGAGLAVGVALSLWNLPGDVRRNGDGRTDKTEEVSRKPTKPTTGPLAIPEKPQLDASGPEESAPLTPPPTEPPPTEPAPTESPLDEVTSSVPAPEQPSPTGEPAPTSFCTRSSSQWNGHVCGRTGRSEQSVTASRSAISPSSRDTSLA